MSHACPTSHQRCQVALVAAEFFSRVYLTELKATLPPARLLGAAPWGDRAAVVEQHSPLLQSLVEALVLRTKASSRRNRLIDRSPSVIRRAAPPLLRNNTAAARGGGHCDCRRKGHPR